MIPTMIVFGVVFGWWWRYSLPAAAVLWAILVVIGGSLSGLSLLVAAGTVVLAAAFGLVNAAVGAIIPLTLKAIVTRRKAAAPTENTL